MGRPPIKRDPIDEIADVMPDFDQERESILRAESLRDPIVGAPMRLQLTPRGELEDIEPGQWMAAGAYSRRTGLPLGCPVTPLGKEGQTAWFLDTLGDIVALEASSSGKGPIGSLFGGRSRWLLWAWPQWSKGTKESPSHINGWAADQARQALVDACAYMGQFSLEDQVRGRGAWRDADGSLIYHAGDEVFFGGKWRPCGEHGGYIYRSRGKIGRPASRAHKGGVGSDGDYLRELLMTFSWDRGELDALLMLGWLMTAKMGGALDRRPIAFITGAEGSGKSVLHALLRCVMNKALIKTSNTTAAGIYQRLQQDSIAIMVDEMEGKDDTRTVDKILELARISYSGDSLQRGGQNGVGKEFTLQSSFLGSSISKPATDAQDDSRMVVLMLRERDAAGGKLDVDQNTLERIGRNLTRRIFDHWGQWDALVGVFRAALIAAGHTDRACDTLSPLAAGAHLAVHDGLPGAEDLAQWTAWLDPREFAETATREKTWRRCLTHLLDAQPPAWASSQHPFKSVGAVLADFRETRNQGDAERYLPQLGLTLSWERDDALEVYETARLFVPAKSPALHALFAGTPWAGRPAAPGPWAGVLRQMPRALWESGKCGKGLDRKASGIFIRLADALEA